MGRPAKRTKPARDIMAESNDEALASLRDLFDGQYAGLTVHVVKAEAGVDDDGVRTVSDDRGTGVAAGGVDFTATILDATGAKVGKVRRIVSTDVNGDLFAEHVRLEIKADTQGQGFAEAFNAALEDWYRESGVSRIELEADISVGGYAWARQGYDWRDGEPNDSVLKRMTRAAYGHTSDDYFIADYTDPAFRDDKRFGTFAVFADFLEDQGDDKPVAVFHDRDDAERFIESDIAASSGNADVAALLARIEAGQKISAYELSQFGRRPGQHGRDATWPGKQIMLGSDWYGVRWL